MGKIRTFLSLNIDQKSITKLEQIQKALKHLLKEYNIKWEKPGKLHITLRFLGDIDDRNIPILITELDKIKTGFNHIEFNVSGIGFFPDTRHANVIFISLTEVNTNSQILIEQIDNVIKIFRIIPDKKFVPHITIGRFRQGRKKRIKEKIDLSFADFKIVFNEFYLMKSILKSKGSEHEIISKFQFQSF